MPKPSAGLSGLFNAAHLAVVSGPDDQSGNRFDLSRGEFYGTAFALAPRLFATALHVYRDAAANGAKVALGRIMTKATQVVMVTDAEEFAQIDLAILQCPGLEAPRLPFEFTPLEYLNEVGAMGFPFGVTLQAIGPHVQILRAFKGHIVTRRGLTELSAIAPVGYETSFVPPPGLSGAPLLSLDMKLAVRGMILREFTAELPHAPERKMTLGIALDIEELLTLDSRLVGGSVAEFLFKRKRVPKRDGTP
jgi:hypothetical protein